MTRRELALDAFWTERPLVALYHASTGAASFSLRQLIAFAESLPEPTFARLTNERGGASQAPPHVAAPTRRPVPRAR